MGGAGYEMRKIQASLTIVALGFLLLISGIVSYQLSIYHSKISVNRSLIHEYRNSTLQRSK